MQRQSMTPVDNRVRPPPGVPDSIFTVDNMRSGHRDDSVRECCERFTRRITRWPLLRLAYTPVTILATALHRDDGFGSGAGVTRNYTDAVRGCLFVDLSVDAGVAAGRAGT